MNRIKILPDNLANQIAAGEVVERPASVIKELVENSLDAGAKSIQIEIEMGGRRLMRVTDDGEGMVKDDAILAFERHATSKITTLEDLAKIATLGFRGEALASIASVAKVELTTKTGDETAATKVFIEGGRLVDVKEIARSTGTTISVRDLFYNTPARRKFMRSEATENYHVASIVTHYALANPGISFVLTNNGRENIRISPAKDLRERAFQLFGASLLESLLPIDGGREYVAKIDGFISAPRERRTTRDAQYFFINGRFVRDKTIAGGLLEGYRAVLPHGVYPVAFLFLEIPVEEIDVNVHPAKTEVRFRRSQAVKDVIAEAVKKALQNAGVIVAKRTDREQEMADNQNRFAAPEDKFANAAQSPIDFKIGSIEEVYRAAEIDSGDRIDGAGDRKNDENLESSSRSDSFEIPAASDDFEHIAQAKFEASFENSATEGESRNKTPVGVQKAPANYYDVLPPVDSASRIPRSVEVEEVSSSKIKPIGQLHESFIIAVDDEGMLLIDQHVAHERILFDKFRRKENDRRIEAQNLLLPETFDLTPAQAVAFDLVEEELENCGFGLMRLSGRTIAIKSVPTDLPAAEIRNLFSEILDTAESEKRGNARETIRDNIAATLACKAAVKINMKLTPEKMQWLIDRLLITTSPTTCPHGRPVILRLTMKDIERGFHRT